MSNKPSIYWPVFLSVAAFSMAAVWRLAPSAPLSDDLRAWCVKWTHRARQALRLETVPEPANDSYNLEPVPQEAIATTQRPVRSNVRKTPNSISRPASNESRQVIKRRDIKVSPQPSTASKTPPMGSVQSPAVSDVATSKPVPTTDADTANESVKITKPQSAKAPQSVADKKARYDELTKQMEDRRHEILRQNVAMSPEGQKALAALKAFKELAAEVDELKKKYGETDSRVVNQRGKLLKLKDEVKRTNERYKAWKERNKAKLLIPEEDPLYRQLMEERQSLED